MLWKDIPETYSEALEEDFNTFQTEYRGLGGWGKVRSLFEGALDEKSEALNLEYAPEVDTGEILVKERENGIDGYTAVLYKESYGARRPVAKSPLMDHENFRHEYTGTHKPDEIGIPGDPSVVDVDSTNLRHMLG